MPGTLRAEPLVSSGRQGRDERQRLAPKQPWSALRGGEGHCSIGELVGVPRHSLPQMKGMTRGSVYLGVGGGSLSSRGADQAPGISAQCRQGSSFAGEVGE